MAVAIVAVAVLVLGSGESVTIHAEFQDAGGLVTGGQVRIAGRAVGSVSGIGLTPTGLADITMSIDGSSRDARRQGMQASIRAVGQAGVANHYVDITPGPPDAPLLPDGAVLPPTQTSGIVSLDAVLNTFDPATRASLQQLIAHSAQIYAGSGAQYFNGMLGKLDPALGAIDNVSGELASDQAYLGRFVNTAAAAARAVASRQTDLQNAVSNTARSLGAVAVEQHALTGFLAAAPAVFTQARGTLGSLSTTAVALQPTLREVPAAAKPLASFLHVLVPTLNTATPVVSQLNEQLPGLKNSLQGFVSLEPSGVAALAAARTAFRLLDPILAGVRVYSPDALIGIVNGVIGTASSPYDAGGHYIHAEFAQPYQTFFGGELSGLFSGNPQLPGIFNIQTKVNRRCPGGNAPPAPDGSNPWIPYPRLCTPSQDESALVNQP